MKIRIRGNSVRFRLSMSEVEALSQKGYFEECTSFPSGVFKYAIRADRGIDTLSASFENDTITLFVPDPDARGWAGSSEVGYRHDLDLPGGEHLALLLEKDFTCLDEREEDQSDNYPNPKAQKE